MILRPQSSVTPQIVADIKDGTDDIPHGADDVKVIGYISLGEDASANAPVPGDGTGHEGKASWYVDINQDGNCDYNPGLDWKSYYVNAGDPQWHDEINANINGLCSMIRL